MVRFAFWLNLLIFNALHIFLFGHKYPCLVASQQMVLEFLFEGADDLGELLLLRVPVVGIRADGFPLLLGEAASLVLLPVTLLVSRHADTLYLAGPLQLRQLDTLLGGQLTQEAHAAPVVVEDTSYLRHEERVGQFGERHALMAIDGLDAQDVPIDMPALLFGLEGLVVYLQDLAEVFALLARLLPELWIVGIVPQLAAGGFLHLADIYVGWLAHLHGEAHFVVGHPCLLFPDRKPQHQLVYRSAGHGECHWSAVVQTARASLAPELADAALAGEAVAAYLDGDAVEVGVGGGLVVHFIAFGAFFEVVPQDDGWDVGGVYGGFKDDSVVHIKNLFYLAELHQHKTYQTIFR